MSLNTIADIVVISIWLWLCFEHWRNQPAEERTAEVPKPQQLEETTEFIDDCVAPKFSSRQFSIGASIALVLIVALALASHS